MSSSLPNPNSSAKGSLANRAEGYRSVQGVVSDLQDLMPNMAMLGPAVPVHSKDGVIRPGQRPPPFSVMQLLVPPTDYFIIAGQRLLHFIFTPAAVQQILESFPLLLNSMLSDSLFNSPSPSFLPPPSPTL
jgi:hypothetical protein